MANGTESNAPGSDAASGRALQAIEARAKSYDEAALYARQPLLDAADKEQKVSKRIRVQLEAMRAPVTPYTSAQSKRWAEMDARDYRRIKDPEQQYDAALRIGDNSRQDQEYRVALQANAPDIGERAQTVFSAEQERIGAKDARKRIEAADEVRARRLLAPTEQGQKHSAAATRTTEVIAAMENVISERKGRAPEQVYDVQARDAAPLRYKSPSQAAERFAALDAAERPIVIRTTRADGVEHSTTVARTVTHDGPEGRVPQKEVAHGVDREFVREYNKASANVAVRRPGPDIEAATPPAPLEAAPRPPDGQRGVKHDQSTRKALPVEEVPRTLDTHFEQRGRHYHFKENPDVVAFTRTGAFRGGALKTAHDDNELVVSAMIDAAQKSGWKSINVEGSNEFRRRAWLEASARGLAVNGYEPTPNDLTTLESREDRALKGGNSISQGRSQLDQERSAASAADGTRAKTRSVDERERKDEGERPAAVRGAEPKVRASEVTGVVIAMGSAPYKHQKGEPDNYYVTVKTARGKEVTVWGKELAKAVKESDLAVGDKVDSIKRVGREAVTVDANIRDKSGEIVGREGRLAHRNEWKIEKGSRVAELNATERIVVEATKLAAPRGTEEVVEREATKQLLTMRASGKTPRVEVYDPQAVPAHSKPRDFPSPTRQRDQARAR